MENGRGEELVGFCMIDMQVGPWIEKAQEHLKALGLKVEGILLGEDDILSRSDFEKPLAPGESDKMKLGNFISVIRSKFPLAVINDDMEGCDVGFCTVGGKLLVKPNLHRRCFCRLNCRREDVNGN